MVERFDLDEGGFLGSPGRMVPDEFGDYVRVADYADLEHQIAELRAKVDVQRQSKEYAQRCCEAAEAENARLRALPLKDEMERVLEPFARIALHVEYTDKRDGNVVHRQRIMKNGEHAGYVELTKDDFRAARALLSRLRAGEQEGWRHGPYGYLIKPIGLNEEHWHLAIEPSAYPDEEISVPLYADRDQIPAAPSDQGGGRG